MYTIIFVLSLCTITVYAQTTANTTSTKLRCRLCNRGSTLSDCNKFIMCDPTLEDCYMDELITDQLTTVYEGGCRAKDVCGRSGKKRSDLVACSRCCNLHDDCNKRLCGIKDDTLNNSQCYSCDHRSSEQSEVKKPTDCVTLDTCQKNQVCYATQSDIAGEDTFFYGCLSKLQCQYLMEKAYLDYKVCELNSTAPPDGLSWTEACGNVRRSTTLCHSCCADGGCNYGSCHDLNARIFTLADQGKFDIKTLKNV